MVLFLNSGYNELFLIIIAFFLAIGIIAYGISLLFVYIYFDVTKRNFTRKELFSKAILVTLILLIISGCVCGIVVNAG